MTSYAKKVLPGIMLVIIGVLMVTIVFSRPRGFDEAILVGYLGGLLLGGGILRIFL